jgi:hypothetical protein
LPRTARLTPGGYFYHVLNRGNARRQVFHKEGDYAAFVCSGRLRSAHPSNSSLFA